MGVSATGPALDGRLHPGDVEREALAHPDHVLLGAGAAGAAQHRPHPGHHLPGAERLGHVVVGAELQARHPVGFLGARGEHDDRDVAVPAEGAGHVQAVEPGQGEVQDHQVGVAAPGDLQRLLPVHRR